MPSSSKNLITTGRKPGTRCTRRKEVHESMGAFAVNQISHARIDNQNFPSLVLNLPMPDKCMLVVHRQVNTCQRRTELQRFLMWPSRIMSMENRNRSNSIFGYLREQDNQNGGLIWTKVAPYCFLSRLTFFFRCVSFRPSEALLEFKTSSDIRTFRMLNP